MMTHEPAIHAAMALIRQAGFSVGWVPPETSEGPHVITARNPAGEIWTITGLDPISCMAALRTQLGLHRSSGDFAAASQA